MATSTTATSSPISTATATDAAASAAASAAACDGAWVCPTPEQLHAELAARWHALYSLAARAGAWRRPLVERSWKGPAAAALARIPLRPRQKKRGFNV